MSMQTENNVESTTTPSNGVASQEIAKENSINEIKENEVNNGKDINDVDNDASKSLNTVPKTIENDLNIKEESQLEENNSNNLLEQNNDKDQINIYNSKLKKSLDSINRPSLNKNKKRKNNEILTNNYNSDLPAKVILIDNKNRALNKTKINTNLNEIKDSIDLDNDYDEDEITNDKGSFFRSGTFPLNSKTKLLTRNQITGWSKF